MMVVNASKQVGKNISASAKLGKWGEEVSIKAYQGSSKSMHQ
jgi:hypothetical protein